MIAPTRKELEKLIKELRDNDLHEKADEIEKSINGWETYCKEMQKTANRYIHESHKAKH